MANYDSGITWDNGLRWDVAETTNKHKIMSKIKLNLQSKSDTEVLSSGNREQG